MKPIRRRHRYALWLATGLMALGLLGLVLRWTVKDRWPVVATLFYGLPPLVAAVYLAISTCLFAWLRKKRRGVIALMATAVGVFAWIQSDYVRAAIHEPAGEGFRVVLWNISDPDVIGEAMLSVLRQADGQIVVLVESGIRNRKRPEFWASHFPGYHLSALGGGLKLLSKFPISDAAMKTMGAETHFGLYDLDTPFGRVSVVVADIISNPVVPRKAYIDRAYEIAATRPYPTIVLGDFNTPHTSVFFRDFRRTYQHAFETSGHGLETTWLAPLPVLTLDHVWLSEAFTPLRTTLKRTFQSDHAMVVADVQLSDGFGHVPDGEGVAHD